MALLWRTPIAEISSSPWHSTEFLSHSSSIIFVH
jgi:hypothetical protein